MSTRSLFEKMTVPKGPHGEDKPKDVQKVFEDVEPMEEDSGSLLVSRIQETGSGTPLQGLEWKEFLGAGLRNRGGNVRWNSHMWCVVQTVRARRKLSTGEHHRILNGLMFTRSKARGGSMKDGG